MKNPGRRMKVVLAYSGGLDTSVMIPWLKEHYDCDVVAFIADVGQGEDLAAVKRKAMRTGAAKAVVLDLKERFARAYVWPTLKAGAVYEGKYLLGTAMARPCIAEGQVRVALRENADAVAHGATGKGNDQVRFELAARILAPRLKVIAPWREWDLKSRSDEVAYAAERGVPVGPAKTRTYSIDANLWHTSYEGGELEDLSRILPAGALAGFTPPERAPARGAKVRIGFVRGEPVAVNGRRAPAAALIARLNALGAAHGVGVADCVENRLVGMKSRGVYVTPGGTLLHAALSELAAVSLDRDTWRARQRLGQTYADLVYNGLWFTPLREAIDAFMRSASGALTGDVVLGLRQGAVRVLARVSPRSRYRASLVTFEEGEAYDHRHAEGFIRLFGLPFSGGRKAP